MAAVLLLGSLLFALQVTAVTPLSASTSSQHIENEEESTAAGVLAAGIEDGSLSRGLRYCTRASGVPKYYGTASRKYYVSAPIGSSGSTTGFGEKLEHAFSDRSIAFNIYLTYNDDGDRVREEFIYQGNPSDNAVVEKRTITLMEGEAITDDPGDGSLVELPSDTVDVVECYGEDSTTDGIYRVIDVEVVVWRQ